MAEQEFLADRRAFLAALAAMVATPAISLAKAPGGAHSAIRAMVDRYVAQKMAPNMVVAIGGRDGPPDFISAGRLEMDTGPLVGPDTLYGLYSMTKPIAAFVMMALIEDEKLTLDTKVSDFFPAFAQMRVLTDPEKSLETRPAIKPITIRHLVTHTSGFGADFNVTGPLKDLYAADSLALRRRTGPGVKGPASLVAFAEACASLPLLFEPGTQFKYSNGLDIAVAIAEKVSGTPFETLLAERLYTPLGMKDTFYTVPPSKLDRLSAAYRPKNGGLELAETARNSGYALPISFPMGSGGLVSSARDYARFMAMLLNEGELDGRRVMKTKTAQLMMSNLMEPGVVSHNTYGDTGYGAGGLSRTIGVPGREGIGAYGWTGAANTQAWVDRASGAYIVIMTQITQWYPNPIYGDFIGAHFSDLASR